MKKVTVWYACINGGDGSVALDWYLKREEAEEREDGQSEGWGGSCVGSIETFEGSDVHQEAKKNSDEQAHKHEYLKSENYYETRRVSSGRVTKTCEHCRGTIKIGEPSDVHHFYPEFFSYPTHPACTEAFMKSLRD